MPPVGVTTEGRPSDMASMIACGSESSCVGCVWMSMTFHTSPIFPGYPQMRTRSLIPRRGGAEKDESADDAAAREMEEETGYRPSRPLEHLVGYYPSYGCGNQRFELFLAEDPLRVRETPDPEEVISTRWFKKEELLGMIQRNEIVDGLSPTPLLLVLLRDAILSRPAG